MDGAVFDRARGEDREWVRQQLSPERAIAFVVPVAEDDAVVGGCGGERSGRFRVEAERIDQCEHVAGAIEHGVGGEVDLVMG